MAEKRGAKVAKKATSVAKPSPRPEVHPPDRAAWRAWLHEHHASSTGVWLIYDKKSSRVDRLAYAASVEEALCFGWIDSVMSPIDDTRYKQLFTPRKITSEWSALNKKRLEAMIAAGKMTPAGQASIDVAKANGSWTKIDHVEAHVMPDDLRKALTANPTARKHFEAFAPSVRKAVLHRIGSAKRPETRAARVAQAVALAEKNSHVGVLVRARIEANRSKKK